MVPTPTLSLEWKEAISPSCFSASGRSGLDWQGPPPPSCLLPVARISGWTQEEGMGDHREETGAQLELSWSSLDARPF